MARRQPRRQIAEERRQFRIDLEPVIDRTNARHVFCAHLLRENQSVPQRRLQTLDRTRHDIGHHACALAAADHQQTQRAGRFGGDEFHRRCREDRRTHRRADGGGFSRKLWVAVEHAWQRGRDRGYPARQKAVGAAEHRIGLVNDAGHAEQPRRQQRRQCRISAKTDHGRRSQPAHQVERHGRAGGERGAGKGQRPRRSAAHGCARHHVDGVLGEQAAVAQRAGIGGKAYAIAAPDQFDAERLGRKQMAAGTARGQQNQRRSGHGLFFFRVPASRATEPPDDGLREAIRRLQHKAERSSP